MRQATGKVNFMANRWGKNVRDFIFGGSKITEVGDCSHEIKRCLLLGKRAMTNLDNILKSSYFWKRGYGGIGIMFMRQLCFSSPFNSLPNHSLTKPGTWQPSASSLHNSSICKDP